MESLSPRARRRGGNHDGDRSPDRGRTWHRKAARPIAVALLDLVTLGVYGCVWYYRVHRELAALGSARRTAELGESPRRSLLAVLPGFLLVVPMVISFWNAARRVVAAERLVGESQSVNGLIVVILLLLLFPAGAGYVQSHLNRVWAKQAAIGEPEAGPRDSELVASR